MSKKENEKLDKRKRFELEADSDENTGTEEGKTGHNNLAIGISLGMVFGVSVGNLMGQLAFGISFGMLIGLAIGVAMDRKQK